MDYCVCSVGGEALIWGAASGLGLLSWHAGFGPVSCLGVGTKEAMH